MTYAIELDEATKNVSTHAVVSRLQNLVGAALVDRELLLEALAQSRQERDNLKSVIDQRTKQLNEERSLRLGTEANLLSQSKHSTDIARPTPVNSLATDVTEEMRKYKQNKMTKPAVGTHFKMTCGKSVLYGTVSSWSGGGSDTGCFLEIDGLNSPKGIWWVNFAEWEIEVV